MRQAEGDVGLDEANTRAAIVALPLEAITMERRLRDRAIKRIGELDLVAGAAGFLVELLEHDRIEDVSADDRERRRCRFRLRLLDKTPGFRKPPLLSRNIENAVAIGLISSDVFD